MRLLISIFLFALPLMASAENTLPVYPTGFDKTGIVFQSFVLTKLEDQRRWYCTTVQYVKVKRWTGLSESVKADLSKQFKLADVLCDSQGKFIGLSGPKNENERAYVDFQTLSYSTFFLRSAVESLGENDEISGGVKLLNEGLTDLMPWFLAQTGYAPDSFPKIYDKAKYDWTSSIDGWVTLMHSFYTN